MENYSQKQDIFNLTVDEDAKAQLLETARWTKFLAILGFVFLGLLIVLAIFIGLGFSAFSGVSDMNGAFGIGMMMAYMVVALLYFFPIYYLYKYSVLIRPSIMNSNQEQFNLALSYQRRMFKFIGILMLIVLALYGLAFVFGIIGAAIGGFA